MALPKEPRQKMINIMYLVLTALLALNVSSEILNAFRTVNDSLGNSNVSIDNKNATIFKSFQEKIKQAETKQLAEVWFPKADAAKKLSDEAVAYIDQLKLQLKKESKLEMVDGKEKFNEDNLDAATRTLVEGPGKAKGVELLKKLTDFKTKILAVDPEIAKEFSNTLPLDLAIPKSSNNNKVAEKDWAYAYFHMTPTIAAITILTKFQNDIKNSEAQIVEYCHKKIGEVQVRYDAFQAIASQNAEYLMPGQELRITGGVGAFSSAAKPTVTVDGASIALNAEGVAEYKTTVGGPGSYTKKVSISFKKPDGTIGTLDKEIKYTVGSPTGITVSADAVKVLYVGLDNPISVTGGAKGAESVQATINNGSLENKGNGKYIANVTTPGTATISVRGEGGKVENFEFKVKTVPPPTPKIGAQSGGRMSANTFKAQVGLRADLENFVFDGVKYDVLGFTMICTGKGFEATGPQVSDNSGAYFTPETKRIMEMVRGGSTVILDRIRVSGPSGTTTLDKTPAFNITN